MQAATKAAGPQSAAAADRSAEASSSKLPSAKISNRNLWQILIGHSALRDPDLIQAEVTACSDRLLEGLAHYRAPRLSSILLQYEKRTLSAVHTASDEKLDESLGTRLAPDAASEKKLKESNRVKGKKLAFVLAVSKQLHLDQLQALELFQGFHYDAYRGSIADLKTKLGSKRETQRLLQQITEYYYSERLFVLRCLKHLLGYWQDSRHPYRGAYAACVEEMNKDEESLIKGVWKQYEHCTKAEFPSTVQSSMQETSWLLHNLQEQCELLEIALLYYKDYVHPPSQLLETAKLFQALGFGLRQQSRVGLLPRAEAITTHLSHLCSLVLVEAMDLDWIYSTIDDPDQIREHDLLKDVANFKELENVILEWGNLQCHTPILLAWTVLKFIAQTKTEIEYTRSLGNRALEGGVFSYLCSLLKSPYFTGDRPVAGVCKRLVHTLLSLVVTAFNEESLGNPANLVTIAAKTLTHPLLRLQLWEKGTASGVGLLLASAQTRFPLELAPLLGLLLPLAGDPYSAHSVFQLLQEMPFYAEQFSTHSLGAYIDLGEQEGERVLTTVRALYSDVSRRLGHPPLVLPPGTRGTVMAAVEGGSPAICWEFGYSAWELFALETGSVLLYPGIGVDSTSHPVVERVAQVARLVTEILKQDWSLAPHLRPITSQYFAIIQKFSPFPNPPSHLLSACLQCLAVMATNESEETWKKLSQTGFLPYLKSSFTDVKSIAVVPGHFGQLLNVWERPRGIYPISMAMLELLLSGLPPSNSLATNEQLACIVFVMREMFAGFHKWRYRNAGDKDEICHKLLQLCHNVLSLGHDQNNGRDFVSHFLLHTVGGQAVLSVLSTGVDDVNRMCSSSHSVSQPILSVESLKLAFSIIDLLLQSKRDQAPTPLEQALATQSMKRSADGISVSSPIHLVAVIASYIHHRDDPHVPAGATRLLTRLAQVAPMSMFACLGQEAVAIRDAYVNRLAASSEDTELKIATLELIRESVSSQPGLVELFLCVRAANREEKEQSAYVLEPESCLHSILDLINPDIQGPQHPPSLLHASTALLHALWQGRHDAALIALRGHKDFWRHLTNPLFNDIQLDDIQDPEDTSHELLVCSHVMHIVAMETYYVMQNRMDKDLVDVMKEFSRSDRYRIWSECLKSLLPKGEDISEPPPSASVSEKVLGAQYELVQAWRTLLLVASSYQESVFDLLDCSLRAQLLEDILEALESQLAAPLQGATVPMATELSLLYMVLFRKWSIDADLRLSGSTVSHFCGLLQHASRLEPGLTSQLHIHCFSTLLLLLRVARSRRVEHLEPRFLLGLVPYLAEVIQNHHFYLRMENRPEPLAVYLLSELVQSLPDPALWLPTLKQHSVIAMLMRLLDEHLKLKNEVGLIEAILSCFLSFSRTTPGAEALVVNGVNQVLCVSMADALLAKLEPALQEKQLNGSAYLKPLLPPPEWCRSWQLALKLAASLVGSLGHRVVPQALDFTGVYQERLLKALDIFETIHDLQSLEQTLASCQFVQQLASYRQQWQFSLPALHGAVIERTVYLVNSVAAILGKRATLKHIIKTMNAAGVLPPDCGPALTRRRRVSTTSQSDSDDSWVTSSPAFGQLQDRLLLTLKSCLATLKHYTPSLEAMITDGALDLHEYPPLFTLSLSPPMVDCATPPSLGTLTACLSTGLALMNKLDPHRVGTPSRSPSKSPAHPRTIANAQKRSDLLCLLEHSVILLLSQATRYLVDSSVESHDKQVLKKELANELGNFSQGLLLNFTRKGAPSPGGSAMRLSTPGGSLSMLDTSSGKASSLSFSDSSEQGIFRLADSFAKQFFR